jgi:hypothetical protein
MAGSETKECLKCRRRCFATVVPKDEFIQVNLQLVLAHSVIGSDEPLLEVSNSPIGKRDGGLCAFTQLRSEGLVMNDMFEASCYET